ncbi:MAG: hypothetical protein ACRD3C_11985 [Vicinamibacterales bacterium]
MFVGDFRLAVAQVRTSRPAGQPAVVIDHTRRPAPPTNTSPTPRSLSQLRFEPRPDVRQVPGPWRAGVGVAPFGVITWWPSWTGVWPTGGAAAPTVQVMPAQGDLFGGVQLDIQPWRAQVYVDGSYMGLVSDFTGYYHPLELVAGPHAIAIVAPDYDPLTLEVLVSPGSTTTFRGALTRAYGR